MGQWVYTANPHNLKFNASSLKMYMQNAFKEGDIGTHTIQAYIKLSK